MAISTPPMDTNDKIARTLVGGAELGCIGYTFMKSLSGLSPAIPVLVTLGSLFLNKQLFDADSSENEVCADIGSSFDAASLGTITEENYDEYMKASAIDV